MVSCLRFPYIHNIAQDHRFVKSPYKIFEISELRKRLKKRTSGDIENAASIFKKFDYIENICYIKQKNNRPQGGWPEYEIRNSTRPGQVQGGFSMLKALLTERKNECQQC